MKRLSSRFGRGKNKKGDDDSMQTPQSDHAVPLEDDSYEGMESFPLIGATLLSPYEKSFRASVNSEAYEQALASRQINPLNGGSRRGLSMRSSSGPVSVDSPDASPHSSPPSSPGNAATYDFSPERVGKKPLTGQDASQSVPSVNSLPTELNQLGQESYSSAFLEPANQFPKEDIRYLQKSLPDAQQVVKSVVGVKRVDRSACLKATLQYDHMQQELEQLRQDHKVSLEAQHDLEIQLTQSRLNMKRYTMTNTSLERELQNNQHNSTKELHADQRYSASSSLADHVDGVTMEPEEYFTKSFEDHLESQLASMRETLDQRQTEVDELKMVLIKEGGAGTQKTTEEMERTKKELKDARDEIAELEKEQQLNMTEIVTLSRQIRSTSEMQKAMGKGGNNKDLERKCEESQKRVEELEQERVFRLKAHADLLEQLDGSQSQLSNFKDLDADANYPQRIALLEKRLEKKSKQNVKALVKKNEEIEKLKSEMEEGTLQSTSWESAANESAVQVMKMAKHMTENQEYLATLEEDVRGLIAHLEDAETKIAHLEDKHWIRDQKLSGMETMYHESQRKIKILAGENQSIRSSFTDERSAANVLRAEGTITSMKRSVREEDADRRIESLTFDLEESTKKFQEIALELESSRTKESSTRIKIDKLKKEKSVLENELTGLEGQLRSGENRRSSEASFTMGLEAKQLAVQAKMLKLEQENKALKRKLDKMEVQSHTAEKNAEKKGALYASSIGAAESLELNMQLQASRSAMNKLQMELVETKVKIEETERALESERKLRASDVEMLTENLEDSVVKSSLPEEMYEGSIGKKRMNTMREDSMRSMKNGLMMDDCSLQISLGESYSEAKCNNSVEADVLIQDLQSQLAAKEEQMRRKEEDYDMQVDQVEGLRQRLQEALTNLEDLEYQQNFNNAKVSELTRLATNEGNDEPHEMLRQKAIQVAELETRMEKAEKEAEERKKLIEKLETECSVHKTKVAELSEIWNNQAKDERARKNVLAKAIEVAELLDESNQQIEQLEVEKGELAAQYAALNLKLADGMQMINELRERLEKEQRSKKEMEQIMEASGIKIFDVEANNGESPNARKRAISMPSSALNSQESERIKQLELALSQQQAIISSLARSGPSNPVLNKERRDETTSGEKTLGHVSDAVARINQGGFSALL